MPKLGKRYVTYCRVVDCGNLNSATTVQAYAFSVDSSNVYIALNSVADITTVSYSGFTNDIANTYKQFRIPRVVFRFIPHTNVNLAAGTSSVDSMGLIYTSAESFQNIPTLTEAVMSEDSTVKTRDWSKPFSETVPMWVIVPILKNFNDTTVEGAPSDLRNALAFTRVPAMWLDTADADTPTVRHYDYNFLMNATSNSADVNFRLIAYIYVECRYPK